MCGTEHSDKAAATHKELSNLASGVVLPESVAIRLLGASELGRQNTLFQQESKAIKPIFGIQ